MSKYSYFISPKLRYRGARICMDPRSFGDQDPDPLSSTLGGGREVIQMKNQVDVRSEFSPLPPQLDSYGLSSWFLIVKFWS
jgi:hypothetical protein